MWDETKEGGNSARDRTRSARKTRESGRLLDMYTKNETSNSLHTPSYQSNKCIQSHEDEQTQPEILTPPPSCEEPKSPESAVKEPPPDLPKMFLDLLEPVHGLRPKKLEFICPVCSLRLASQNSLIIHNKTHCRPACLNCLKRFPSHSTMARHSHSCRQVTTVLVTSKYGRSRNVRCYLGLS